MSAPRFTIEIRFDLAPRRPPVVRGLVRAIQVASAYARAYGWACVKRRGRTVASVLAHDVAEGGARA